MSIRQQIVDAISTRLGLIHSGYGFTLPDGNYTCAVTPLSVTAWRRVPYSLAQVPALAFWDTSSGIIDGPSSHHTHRLEITVIGFVAGSTSDDTARSLLSDVMAAVASDRTWGGLATWTEISDQVLQVEQSADVIAGCEIKLVVVYRTRLGRS